MAENAVEVFVNVKGLYSRLLGSASIATNSLLVGLKSYALIVSQRITNRMQVLLDVWIVWNPAKRDVEVMLLFVKGSKLMKRGIVWIAQQRLPTGQITSANHAFQRIISQINPGKNALIAVIPVKLTQRYSRDASVSHDQTKCLSFEEYCRKDSWNSRESCGVKPLKKQRKILRRIKKNVFFYNRNFAWFFIPNMFFKR